jgi:ribosome-associated heat shock protein Hsp15
MSKATARDSDPKDGRMRLDIWLWRARFFKTRTAAADAVVAGGVNIERSGQVRRIDKPATPVSAGDVLAFLAPSGQQLVTVLSLPDRRGPPEEAAAAFARIGPPIPHAGKA